MRNEEMRLSQHFTLGELCKTKTGIENVPNEAQVENLKRLCSWLEELREKNSLTPDPGLTPNPSPRGGSLTPNPSPKGEGNSDLR